MLTWTTSNGAYDIGNQELHLTASVFPPKFLHNCAKLPITDLDRQFVSVCVFAGLFSNPKTLEQKRL